MIEAATRRISGPAWIEPLDRDGCAVVSDAIDAQEVADLIAAVDRAGAGGSALRRGADLYGMRDLIRRSPEVRRLAASGPIRALVGPILGPSAFAVRGLLFDKTPGANWNLPWHRDLTIAVRRRLDVPGFGPWSVKAGTPHVRAPVEVLGRMLTVRLHLDDCGAANGPLQTLPGSHRVGPGGVAEIAPWLGRVAPVACLVPPGGAVLMRPLLLHASSAALRPGHRRVIHLEFAAGPLPGGLEWAEPVDPIGQHEGAP